MMRNFKLFGAMLVFLVSLESCKGCAVGAGAGAGAGCPAGQERVGAECKVIPPYTCPAGQINIDDGKTATSCKAVVAVADKNELVSEIKKATAGGKWTANLNYIDTSKVIDFYYLFADKTKSNGQGGNDLEKFNGRIDKWNTSNIKTMTGAFAYATAFNQDISKWNTSNVKNMENMFLNAEAFDQPIGNWNVSNVTNMNSMFIYAAKFNQPIGDWKVDKVTDMVNMFNGATAFDKDLSKWTPVAIANNFYLSTMFYGSAMFKANKLPTFAPWYCTISGAGTGAGGGCP